MKCFIIDLFTKLIAVHYGIGFFFKYTMLHSIFASEGIIISRLPFWKQSGKHLCRQLTRFCNRANEGAHQMLDINIDRYYVEKTQMLTMCDLLFDCVPLFAMFLRSVLSVSALFSITHSHMQ